MNGVCGVVGLISNHIVCLTCHSKEICPHTTCFGEFDNPLLDELAKKGKDQKTRSLRGCFSKKKIQFSPDTSHQILSGELEKYLEEMDNMYCLSETSTPCKTCKVDMKVGMCEQIDVFCRTKIFKVIGIHSS